MIKKSALTLLMVLLLVPSLASAVNMQVTSSALPATGGTITPNGLKFFAAAATYTIAVTPGWAIGSVLIDGVNSPNGLALTQTIPFDTTKTHTIKVTFTQTTFSITANAGTGGSIQVTGGGNTMIPPGASRSAVVAPATYNKITSITVDGTPVTPANPLVAYTVPFNNIQANHTVAATFGFVPAITCSAGADKTLTGDSSGAASTQLTGSATSNAGAITYQWNVTSKPAGATATIGSPNNAITVFNVNSIGTYQVSLTATSGGSSVTSAPVTITVLTSTQTGSTACTTCHNGSAEVTAWTASKHATTTNGATCIACHMPNSEPHPGAAYALVRTICTSCHVNSSGSFVIGNHASSFANSVCVSCHNPHSTAAAGNGIPSGAHFNNITTGMYPASFVRTPDNCTECHIDNDQTNYNNRHAWGASGHADTNALPWIDYDFKTRSGCVQCHTTTGFIAFSTARVTTAWGVASDKTKEVLTCKGCHTSIATGAVRSVTPVKPFAGEPSYTNRNVGESNICMDCHSGRNNGLSVTSPDFTNQGFIAPHYLTAAGTLQGKSAYLFPGQPYALYTTNNHLRKIGMGSMNTGSAGPCIACHKGTNGHKFAVTTLANDGTISSIDTALCTNCHGASMDATQLSADMAAFNNGLIVLNAALKAKGFTYTSGYPYFANKNWGNANTMGAAFNYVLLLKEPGAYAHNAAYAKQLIVDSIDAAYNNGTVTGDITTALAALVADPNSGVTQGMADSLITYKSTTNAGCSSCHTFSPGSLTTHTTHANKSIGCATCHSTTAASNTALVAGGGQHLNNQVNVSLAAGGSYSGGLAGSCSTVYCHSNGALTYAAPVWGSGALNCFSCHPLASLRGAHAAHVGTTQVPTFYGDTGNNSLAGEYRFGCGNCHPTAATSHVDGHIDLSLAPADGGVLKSLNKLGTIASGIGGTDSGIAGSTGLSITCSAAYCHSDGKGTFVTSPDWYNAAAYTGDRCAMCHANAPATGAHAKHGKSIHDGKVFDGSSALLPEAASVGTSAGHGDPAQSTTISCDMCHSATVTSNANDLNAACASCHNNGSAKGTPALNKANHLNGAINVSFKDVKLVTKAQVRTASFDGYSGIWSRTSYKAGAGSFDTTKKSLSVAGYASADKSCANVACHNGGTPKWTDTLSCVDCHSSL